MPERQRACASRAIAGLSFAYLRAGTLLLAKNVAVNMSNNDLRGALDQLQDRLQSVTNVPILINTSGAVATAHAASCVD